MINLEYMCVAMIVNIKSTLLESDFSMCLANLLKYPEPESPESIIKIAMKIKEKITQKTNPCSLESIVSSP